MRKLLLLIAVLVTLTLPSAASGPRSLSISTGESDAEGIVILHAFYPGYWWDHTDLTVAVQAAPGVDPALFAAVREAIADWNDVLQDEFSGLITLTDVTDEYTAKHKADIVLHYVPTAGGVVFAGYAICGDHKCNNVIVRSDLPLGFGNGTYTPLHLYRITMHELGHALGIGHAEPLLESIDLMAYGWIIEDEEPILSNCDLNAVAYVFAWAIEGVDPYPPTAPFLACQ
jgi:hypothetical protein